MTISSTQSVAVLLGNGVTSVWDFSFVSDASNYIFVTYTNADGVATILQDSQYTLTINPPTTGQLWSNSFSIEYPLVGSPIANGTSLTVQRILPLQQLTSLSNQGNFYPAAVEAALDTLEMQIQQVSARTGAYRGVWATGTAYNFGDIVQDGVNGAYTNNIYVAAQGNTSGVWATDLANGDWVLSISVATLQPGSFPLTGGTISGNLAVTGHTTFEGVTSTGATGTGKLVYASAPTLTALNISGLTASELIATDGSNNLVSTAVLPNGTTATTGSEGDVSTEVSTNQFANSILSGIDDFRLTLTSGTPVTTGDVTGAITIYCTPYKGNRIALYDGTRWNLRTSAEFSLALGTLTSGLPYDVFCYDNSGVPALEFLAWTSGTVRATTLAYQDGVLSKTGALTRRYLGTFYTTATTTTEDSVANRYLWNYYNRIKRSMARKETTASWTYSTATLRQANGSTSNQLNFVVGVAEDSVEASVGGLEVVSSGVLRTVASTIGLDSTTAAATGVLAGIVTVGTNQLSVTSAKFVGIPSVGVHYLAWLEGGAGADTQTWYATAAFSLYAGIEGSVFA